MRRNFILPIILGLVLIPVLIFFKRQLDIFFFDSFFSKPKEISLAQISQTILKAIEPPVFKAKSIFSVKVNNSGEEYEVVYSKSSGLKLSIASLTKLMTAVIASENYSQDTKIKISKEAVSQEGDAGKLIIGESISVKNLLLSTLIESSNDAAFALAENIGKEIFLEKMNLRAKEIGMLDTNFLNPSGLNGPLILPQAVSASSPQAGSTNPLRAGLTGSLLNSNNYSTAEDLAKLIKYIIINHPQILEITSKLAVEILNDNGTLHNLALNSNQLLAEDSKWRNEIVGGKTGYNEEADGCLVLVLRDEKGEYLINIILGSPDRFGEMKDLVNWLKHSGQWD